MREAEFAHEQTFDREGLIGRAYSSSYVVHGIADHAGFDRALGEVFEQHARDGRVAFRLTAPWRSASGWARNPRPSKPEASGCSDFT